MTTRSTVSHAVLAGPFSKILRPCQDWQPESTHSLRKFRQYHPTTSNTGL